MSKPCQPQRWVVWNPSLITSVCPCLASLELTQPQRLCGKGHLVLLLALTEKRILYFLLLFFLIILMQGSFMFLCLFLISADKISCCIAWGKILLRVCNTLYIPGTCKWLYCLLVQYLCGCEERKDIGGHGADRVEGDQCSVKLEIPCALLLMSVSCGSKAIGEWLLSYFTISRSDNRGGFDVTDKLPSS